MLTRLEIKNFKRLANVSLDLGGTVVFVGPNNTGKTSALQALSLWDYGMQSWLEHYPDAGGVPAKRPGITLNRKDFFAIPTPGIRNLWDGLHVRDTRRVNGKPVTCNVKIVLTARGISDAGGEWACGFEFDYASSETCYCKPVPDKDGKLSVPKAAANCRTAFLPPMSGLGDREFIKQQGEIDTLIGEGQTAQVLRNLCQSLAKNQPMDWQKVAAHIRRLFGVALDAPLIARDRITLAYKEGDNKTAMDISCAGRGLQQTLLLLVYLYANPGRVILLDEPDAHLECLRQRQVFALLVETAGKLGSQIIAASHSEVVLNEAVERGTVVAFIGQPHALQKKDQLLKALQDYGFEDYLNAERNGWVLYVEDYTDHEILKAFAKKLDHPAHAILDSPVFIRRLGTNLPQQARDHFFALREAKPGFIGVALFDRLEKTLAPEGALREIMWRRREIENYFCTRGALLGFARSLDDRKWDEEKEPLFARDASEGETPCVKKMAGVISKLESAVATLGKPSPWSGEIKATDDFLVPLFNKFSVEINRPLVIRKGYYHQLVDFMRPEDIDPEVREKLDAIYEVASKAVASQGTTWKKP